MLAVVRVQSYSYQHLVVNTSEIGKGYVKAGSIIHMVYIAIKMLETYQYLVITVGSHGLHGLVGGKGHRSSAVT